MKGLHRARLIFGAAILGCAGVGHATILTFDETRNATGAQVVDTVSGATVQQDYGDFVTGSSMPVAGGAFTYGDGGEGFTPNVAVEYFAGTGGRVAQWIAGYGDLVNVLFAPTLAGPADSLNVRLTADPGFEVQLWGFDLGGWSADYLIGGVTVTSGTGTLFSQPDVLVEGGASGPGRTTFGFTSPLVGQDLLIALDISNIIAGAQDNIGLDNIRFGQIGLTPPVSVAEPGSLWMLAASLLTFGLLRSRSAPRRAPHGEPPRERTFIRPRRAAGRPGGFPDSGR